MDQSVQGMLQPDRKTITLEEKVFQDETDVQVVPPWPGNPK